MKQNYGKFLFKLILLSCICTGVFSIIVAGMVSPDGQEECSGNVVVNAYVVENCGNNQCVLIKPWSTDNTLVFIPLF